MTIISQRELRNSSGEVLRRVEAGARYTVTRRGVPVADLVPHVDPEVIGPTRFVDARRFLGVLDGVGDWNVAAFAHERDQFDAVIDDDDRDPWAPA